MKEEQIDEVTNNLYLAYGSGTGVLFGIPSELRPSVRAIVKVILRQRDQEVKNVIGLSYYDDDVRKRVLRKLGIDTE